MKIVILVDKLIGPEMKSTIMVFIGTNDGFVPTIYLTESKLSVNDGLLIIITV